MGFRGPAPGDDSYCTALTYLATPLKVKNTRPFCKATPQILTYPSLLVIVSAEITGRTEKELSTIYARVTRELTQSELGTPERRNALASLDNVVTELNVRRMMEPTF